MIGLAPSSINFKCPLTMLIKWKLNDLCFEVLFLMCMSHDSCIHIIRLSIIQLLLLSDIFIAHFHFCYFSAFCPKVKLLLGFRWTGNLRESMPLYLVSLIWYSASLLLVWHEREDLHIWSWWSLTEEHTWLKVICLSREKVERDFYKGFNPDPAISVWFQKIERQPGTSGSQENKQSKYIFYYYKQH